MASAIVGILILCASLPASAQSSSRLDTAFEQRLRTLERAIAADPENLKLGADYRQLTIAAGLYDRAIDFFRPLAKAHCSRRRSEFGVSFCSILLRRNAPMGALQSCGRL